MKEFLDAMLARIKSPILGISSIIYLVANLPVIARFFIVDNATKLEMLSNYQIDYWLLVKCILISIAYIIASDWIQVIIDRVVMKAKETRNKINYNSKSRVVALEYKSTKEYQEKLVDKDLEDWSNRKTLLEEQLEEANKTLSTTSKVISRHKERNTFLEESLEQRIKNAVHIKRLLSDIDGSLSQLENEFNIRSIEGKQVWGEVPPKDKEGNVLRMTDAKWEFMGSNLNQIRSAIIAIEKENEVPLIHSELNKTGAGG